MSGTAGGKIRNKFVYDPEKIFGDTYHRLSDIRTNEESVEIDIKLSSYFNVLTHDPRYPVMDIINTTLKDMSHDTEECIVMNFQKAALTVTIKMPKDLYITIADTEDYNLMKDFSDTLDVLTYEDRKAFASEILRINPPT